MKTTTTTEPTLYVIWHRAGKGKRWKKAGRASSRAEALTMIGGSGDWHLAPLHNERLAGEDTNERTVDSKEQSHEHR
jgi:hypothetical protein